MGRWHSGWMSLGLLERMLAGRVFAKSFGSLASAFILSVPIYYVITGDLRGLEKLARLLSDTSAKSFLYLSVQFIAIPIGLVVGLRQIWHRIRLGVWRGALAGLVFGMWASTVLLMVPYLGAYPNLVIGLLAFLMTDGAEPQYHMTVVTANTLICPLLGALILHWRCPLSLPKMSSGSQHPPSG